MTVFIYWYKYCELILNEMNEQQNHLAQLVEQREKLAVDLEKIGAQTTRTRELFLKTQGAIEYLQAVGVTLPEPEVTEEAEAEEETAEEGWRSDQKAV